jgi:hypothetical protein
MNVTFPATAFLAQSLRISAAAQQPSSRSMAAASKAEHFPIPTPFIRLFFDRARDCFPESGLANSTCWFAGFPPKSPDGFGDKWY